MICCAHAVIASCAILVTTCPNLVPAARRVSQPNIHGATNEWMVGWEALGIGPNTALLNSLSPFTTK